MVVALTKPGWPDGNLILSVVPPEERRRLLPEVGRNSHELEAGRGLRH